MRFDQLHHVGVVVDDIERAATQVERLYGTAVTIFDESVFPCRVDGVDQNPTQRLGLSVGKVPHLELLQAVPGSVVWSEEGIHHLGFVVDDLEFSARALEEAGAPIWMGGIRDGVYPFGATYHRDPLGQVIELLDRRSAARLSARSRTRVDTIIQERRDSCPSQEK